MDFIQTGLSALKNGDYQEAVNIFRRALEKGKSVEAFIGLGRAFYFLGDMAAARWAFYQAIEIEPGNRDAYSFVEQVESRKRAAPHKNSRSLFRVADSFLQIYRGSWKKFFVKGINIGLGIPGHFPGEYAIGKETYRRWFSQILDLGINTIRIYTIHPPSFYEALYEFNKGNPRLFLMQGVWLELPGNGNFLAREYTDYVKGNIRDAVDVVYGTAQLPERLGYPHGTYDHDVSEFTAAFMIGREWESCAVKSFNVARGRQSEDFRGEFIAADGCSPFESWAAGVCNYLQSYEQESCHNSHPVTIITWPTLDPLSHPSESGYEEGLARQGVVVSTAVCSENEDMETFDLAKFRSLKGGGFFATYHVYPYYPDFMNHDFLTSEHPYRSYLDQLKRHHGAQPVLIAEFGVPSSREVTHWHRGGWHHGGHSEVRQGEINGEMMRDISRAGMAGGVLFSWTDEWFKRNWLFLPYELPAERNPLWFNLQDAEQNYGLMALYPGYPDKRVTLSGNEGEWRSATSLYRKTPGRMAHRFNDGGDDARLLTSLSTQHDEGFLYLRLETSGRIDFGAAHYLVGIDTCDPDTGEFLLPCGTNQLSPVGLKFVVHLAGKEKSRLLVCHTYDKYLNSGRPTLTPAPSRQGAWAMMQNITNHRRVSKDGSRFYPSHVFTMSHLRFGSLDRKHEAYDSLADFYFDGNGVEVRIPWGLLNVTDPSSRQVLWMGSGEKTQATDGIRLIAVSYKPEAKRMTASVTGRKTNIADSLPEQLSRTSVRNYIWEGWQTPIFHSYLKESYYRYQEILSGIPEGGRG